MKKMKRFLLSIGLLILIGGGTAGVWSLYEMVYYFSTDNTQIAADMVTITPEVIGKLKSWDVKEGDLVTLGQVLGKQDVSMLVSSTALSAQGLANTADAIIRKAEIKSPLDGKVIRTDVIRGQVISPGMEIATIADTLHMYVKANIEETGIFKIQVGQNVDIKIDAYPGRRFKGSVERIGQATESAFNTFPSLNTSGEFSKVTQLIPVRIALVDIGTLTLMPGMNTTVRIHIHE